MSRRTLNLIAVAGAAAVLVWVVSGVVAGGGGAVATPPSVPQPTPTLGGNATVPAARDVESQTSDRPLRGYALALPDVDGLPSDLQPGDRLQVWVAWDPPLTKRPRIEPLVPKAIYERTVEPILAGEPPSAVVLVPEDRVDELMYGDRYGSLSVSIIDS